MTGPSGPPTAAAPPVPLAGRTVVVGPSNSGKTRLTARALDAWVDRHGADGVVVLDFAPEFERDGALLGGRLSRFTAIPDGAWSGDMEARAPRAEGDSPAETRALAAANARRARRILDRAPPDPTAVLVNDATIPFGDGSLDPARLTDYCGRADVAVVNAFEGDELGTDDAVSRGGRAACEAFKTWADRVVDLAGAEA